MANMKFIVRGAEHSKLIQKALFRMGYKWHTDAPAKLSAPFLFATDDDKSITYTFNTDYFYQHPSAEYVYALGLVEPVMGTTCLVGSIGAEKITVGVPTEPRPPLGLKPRNISDEKYVRNRLVEVSNAIDGCMAAMLKIPAEWVQEFNDRLEEIRKLEKVT